MRRILAMVLALHLTGCAGTGDITVTRTDPTGAKINVTAGPEFYASGCAVLEIDADGSVSLLLSQDGSSDWAGLRAIVAVVPDTVRAAAAAFVGSIEAIIALFGFQRPEMAPRSEIQGCDLFFVQDAPAVVSVPVPEKEAPEDGPGEEIAEGPAPEDPVGE